MDLSQYSNEELMQIAGVGQEQPKVQNTDLSSYSNEELLKISGIEPTEKNLGLNTMAKKILPTFITGAEPLPGERTVLGNIFERPGAAIRSGIRSKVGGGSFSEGYTKGSNLPEDVSTFVQQSQASNVGRPDQPVRTFFKGLARDVGAFALDSVTNPMDLLLDVGFFGASKIGKGSKAIKTSTEAIEQAKKLKNVDKAMNKAIRPSVVGQRTANQIKKAKINSRVAVDSIVRNKQNLKLVDDAGDVVKGTLPKNLDEFSQAIAQTKRDIFNSYTDLSRKAGKEMRVVFVDDIAKELRKSVDSVAINDFAPQAKKAALEIADNLDKRSFYTVEEANDVLETLNQQLQAFYRNPDPKLANQNTVNALVSNKLRSKLDNVINQETLAKGAGKEAQETFKALKQRYGALKSIESDVNRRLVVDARKNVRGLIDFTDIYTGQQLAEGLLTQNPVAMAKGGVGLTAKKIIKKMNNPNTQVKNMFVKTSNEILGIPTVGEQIKTATPITIRTAERIKENSRPIPVRQANR